MKYLLILSIALISGCKEYQHQIKAKKCNGEFIEMTCIDAFSMQKENRDINNYKVALPQLRCGGMRILNVCEVVYDVVSEVTP